MIKGGTNVTKAKRIIAGFIVLLLMASMPVNASNAYVINGVTIRWDDYSSSPDDCWNYANNVYTKIWGQSFSSVFDDNSNSLRDLSDSQLTLTAEHLKEYVSNAALGSCLRICNSDCLHSYDSWGHSQIIVQKDSNGFTVFEGGLTASPHCREKYYSWNEYVNTGWLGGTYSYIKYIKWPSAPAYNSGGTTPSLEPEKPVITGMGELYLSNEPITIQWTYGANTTHCNYWLYRKNGDNWENINRIDYATSPVTEMLDEGDYRVLIVATNSNAGWIWTNSDYAYFSVVNRNIFSPDVPVILQLNEQYYAEERITIRWSYGNNTTHCNYWLYKKRGDEWDVIHRVDYAESPIIENLEAGQYRVLIVATNSNYWNEQGTSWLWTNSDYSYFSVIERHVHHFQSTVIEPTCTKQGSTIHLCAACGDRYVDSYVDALGHSFSAWVRAKAPTCTENGEESRMCSRCDTVETRELAATGHRFENGVCIVCGAINSDGTPPVVFSDIPSGAYFSDAVSWAVAGGVTTGTGDGKFSPNGSCTRAQVVTFLWRATGESKPKIAFNPFTDVKESAYYYQAVLWAVENGVTSGTSSNMFSPNGKCTRAQVVAFLWRAAGQPEPKSTVNPFTDVKENAYYYKAVLWAVENGVTTGTSKITFDPDKPCTRGQVVTFLYRAEGNK